MENEPAWLLRGHFLKELPSGSSFKRWAEILKSSDFTHPGEAMPARFRPTIPFGALQLDRASQPCDLGRIQKQLQRA